MEEQKEKKHGHKGKRQKYKSLLVWNILQKRTDENHAMDTYLTAQDRFKAFLDYFRITY